MSKNVGFFKKSEMSEKSLRGFWKIPQIFQSEKSLRIFSEILQEIVGKFSGIVRKSAILKDLEVPSSTLEKLPSKNQNMRSWNF